MSIQALLPVISQLVGRDLLVMLHRSHIALGAAMTTEEQIFVTKHYMELPKYLESDAGRAAVKELVGRWRESMAPPAVEK